MCDVIAIIQLRGREKREIEDIKAGTLKEKNEMKTFLPHITIFFFAAFISFYSLVMCVVFFENKNIETNNPVNMSWLQYATMSRTATA